MVLPASVESKPNDYYNTLKKIECAFGVLAVAAFEYEVTLMVLNESSTLSRVANTILLIGGNVLVGSFLMSGRLSK